MVLQATVNLTIPTLVPAGVSFRSYCTTTCYFDDINASVILPVQLLEFTGTPSEDGSFNELKWTTGSEKNCRSFQVEKSVDGISFHPIGELNAAGNSHVIHEYSFRDETPSAGTNYYRLAQTEFDGSGSISEIVSVESRTQNNDPVIFPAIGQGEFSWKGTDAPATIIINDVNGRTVKSISLENGHAPIIGLDLKELENGIYFVNTVSAGKMSTGKLLIAH
jgi:hypothetical protein